jgi:hypothetical protein
MLERSESARNNMWAGFRSTVIATMLGCWALPGQADTPAQLVVGEGSIEELLRVPPSLKPGRYAVHCEAWILRSGRTPQAYCYAMETPVPDDLVDAVTKTTLRARFEPAMRDAEAIEVYAVFMVLVDTTSAEPLILAVPNNGVERKKYGLLYTAPQRMIQKPSWGIPPARYLGRRPDRFVLMQFQIDERGNVSDLSVRNLTHENVRTLRRIEEQAREYRFLPGYYEGRPVPMMYMEPSFSVY